MNKCPKGRIVGGRPRPGVRPGRRGRGRGRVSVPGSAGGERRRQRPPDDHHGSLSATPAAAAPRAGARAGAAARRGRGASARHHPLLSRQLLERGPRQVHGLRLVPGETAQRLLPGLRCGPSRPLQAAVAHPGGRPGPGPRAGAAFWLPGLETVPQEREVYHPHRGDRWGGLSWRGPDPVTGRTPRHQEPVPAHHSFIHSFWSQPQPPRHSQSQAAPATGVWRDGGQ